MWSYYVRGDIKRFTVNIKPREMKGSPMVNSSLFTRCNNKILIPYMYRAYVRFLVTWYQGHVLVVTPNFPCVP